MDDLATRGAAPLHGSETVSPWVRRWSHLLAPGCTVLDLACGQGRHMRWFAQRGHPVTGVDRSPEAIAAVAHLGEACLADLESGPWPLRDKDGPRKFGAIIVTNYLWRPMLPTIAGSLKAGGILIYETFATGNETVGKPARPDFLLQSGELLLAFRSLRVIAYEDGFIERPSRFVQRIVAVQPAAPDAGPGNGPPRYPL